MRHDIRSLGLSLVLAGIPAGASVCHGHDLAAPAAAQGEIVLTDTPFCDFFVVQADWGYVLLRWRGDMEIFAEGDRVRGALHDPGRQRIEHVLEPKLLAAVGPVFTDVEIERTHADLGEAQAAYFSTCFPERHALGRMAVSGR